MTINGQTIVLDTRNQNYIIPDVAPFTLSLVTSGVSLNGKIRKIECNWDDGTNQTLTYKPKKGTDNTLFFPDEIGDPRNTIITKDFYANDYTLSIYYNTINFYIFGSSTPYTFNVVLNLTTPDFQINTIFDDFHLTNTRMFGVNNDILYTFTGYVSSTTNDYTLLTLVNWNKKSNKLTAKQLNKPYTINLPFLQKFKNNENIETISYVSSSLNASYNTDNEHIFFTSPTPTPNVTPSTSSQAGGSGGTSGTTPTPTPTITPTLRPTIGFGYLNSPLATWKIIKQNQNVQFIILDSYDYPIHSFGSFSNNFVIDSNLNNFSTDLGCVQNYNPVSNTYSDLDFGLNPPFQQTIAYYGGTNTQNTNNIEVSANANPLIGYALNGVEIHRPAATTSMLNLLNRSAWPDVTGYTYNAAYQAVSQINNTTYQFGHDFSGGISLDRIKYTGYSYMDGTFLSSWIDGVGSTLGYEAPLSELNYIQYYKYSGLTGPDGHSKIIGFSIDGYPIYGPYGYSTYNDRKSGIQIMRSSYVLKNSSYRASYAPTSTYPMGIFIEDYGYVSGHGDLDQSNGRYCVTPEYPNGTYAYFVTVDNSGTPIYPYIIGNIWYNTPAYNNSTNAGNGTLPIFV
jgi:hypothetical protein